MGNAEYMGAALRSMQPGDIWEVYLPSEMAYGDKGVGADIRPGDALIFKLELIQVKERPIDFSKWGRIVALTVLLACMPYSLKVAWRRLVPRRKSTTHHKIK